MKGKRISQSILILVLSVLWWGNSALAEKELPGSIPDDGWIAHNETSPCTHTYYTINYETHRDLTLYEKTILYTEYLPQLGEHVVSCSVELDSSTMTYNCHGEVFIGSDGWLQSPDAFYDAQLYTVGNGGIYRWGDTHSATVGDSGPPYVYYSKMQGAFLCLHDDELYGEHDEEWCEAP